MQRVVATTCRDRGRLLRTRSVVLVIYSETPPRAGGILAEPLIAASDITGHSHRAFLGQDAFGSAGLSRVGVFVTDRYGELRDQWVATEVDKLPAPSEVLSSLWRIQMAC
jgi:hypothetical protein